MQLAIVFYSLFAVIIGQEKGVLTVGMVDEMRRYFQIAHLQGNTLFCCSQMAKLSFRSVSCYFNFVVVCM